MVLVNTLIILVCYEINFAAHFTYIFHSNFEFLSSINFFLSFNYLVPNTTNAIVFCWYIIIHCNS